MYNNCVDTCYVNRKSEATNTSADTEFVDFIKCAENIGTFKEKTSSVNYDTKCSALQSQLFADSNSNINIYDNAFDCDTNCNTSNNISTGENINQEYWECRQGCLFFPAYNEKSKVKTFYNCALECYQSELQIPMWRLSESDQKTFNSTETSYKNCMNSSTNDDCSDFQDLVSTTLFLDNWDSDKTTARKTCSTYCLDQSSTQMDGIDYLTKSESCILNCYKDAESN